LLCFDLAMQLPGPTEVERKHARGQGCAQARGAEVAEG
jgi:hypothetical protein